MKKIRKNKLKVVYWLLAGLAVMVIFFGLLVLHKPAGFEQRQIVNNGRVSLYLTNVLMADLYNGAQLQQPFDLVLEQEGINEAVACSKWPRELGGIRLFAPTVRFAPNKIVLMGTADAGSMEFVVTIVGQPLLDEKGLLNLRIKKIKIGALNLTLFAKTIAERMYEKQLADTDVNSQSFEAKISASLLNNTPFEPVFKIEDKKVRAEKITITDRRLTISFVPAGL